MKEIFDAVLKLITDNPWTMGSICAALLSVVGSTGVFAFRRRPTTESHGDEKYFEDTKLLVPPKPRPAYSDRMAYVLAEMSALAYFRFEGRGKFVADRARQFFGKTFADEKEVAGHLQKFADELLRGGVDDRRFFEQILASSGFELIDTIEVKGTQAFACVRTAPGDPPYVVVAFRGTERKVSDWLTDARAVPTIEGTTKVHTGFHEALAVNTDGQGRTVLQRVQEILADPKAKDANGEPLPTFITGHSLGGALALLATRYAARDINGACYTFGGPRVANYEYFAGIKTPVYRVVNSSDVVPRVPPGAVVPLLVRLVQGLSWLSGFAPSVSKLFDKLEAYLDKLNGYRHFGDQRYLIDVAGGRFQDVRLLHNPPAIDRVLWFWHNIATSLRMPLKSHGMDVYRKKLDYIANRRNRTT